MRRALPLTILLVFCFPIATLGQKAPRPKGPISTAEILNKYIAATGGLEAWHALQTVEARGSLVIEGLNPLGDFDFYYKAPTSDVFQLFALSHGQIAIGHKGGTPFFNRDADAPFGINGVTVVVLEKAWLALTDSDFEHRYVRIEVVGLTAVDGQWAYAVLFTPKVGDREVRFFNCQNFLMVRMDSAQVIRLRKNGPNTAYKLETDYFDYRDSGGIKFPRQIRVSSPDGDLDMDLSNVRTNQPIKDSVFKQK